LAWFQGTLLERSHMALHEATSRITEHLPEPVLRARLPMVAAKAAEQLSADDPRVAQMRRLAECSHHASTRSSHNRLIRLIGLTSTALLVMKLPLSGLTAFIGVLALQAERTLPLRDPPRGGTGAQRCAARRHR
jgi:hypothetical protein